MASASRTDSHAKPKTRYVGGEANMVKWERHMDFYEVFLDIYRLYTTTQIKLGTSIKQAAGRHAGLGSSGEDAINCSHAGAKGNRMW